MASVGLLVELHQATCSTCGVKPPPSNSGPIRVYEGTSCSKRYPLVVAISGRVPNLKYLAVLIVPLK